MYSREQVMEALTRVIYPGSDNNIVSLKMVDEVVVDGNEIRIVLKTQKQKDPVMTSLKHACVQAIKDNMGPDAVVSSVEVIYPEPRAESKIKETGSMPGVKNIIAIASGKGGVGKSTIAVNLAVSLAGLGYSTGLLDADIFGPSAPKMFNEENFRPEIRNEDGTEMIVPLEKYGVKVLSVGFFVDPSDAIVWRGPMASNFLKQLMFQGDWGELDYLVIDMPPGTSDIHLTLVQEVAVTGAVIVSTPQEVALADAVKGISMFTTEKINVPVLGLVENMSWFSPAELPGNKYYIFGKEGCSNLARKMNIPLLGQIPVVQGICESGDSGVPVALGESDTAVAFESMAKTLVQKVGERNASLEPTRRVEIK